jgi:hypothetical protein
MRAGLRHKGPGRNRDSGVTEDRDDLSREAYLAHRRRLMAEGMPPSQRGARGSGRKTNPILIIGLIVIGLIVMGISGGIRSAIFSRDDDDDDDRRHSSRNRGISITIDDDKPSPSPGASNAASPSPAASVQETAAPAPPAPPSPPGG